MTLDKKTLDFIFKARLVHGDKYDYSKVEYKNSRTKVCIVCPIHGEFLQTPHAHLTGYGCSKCGGKQKLTTEEFIEHAKAIHGDKYDYSKVEYINNKTEVCIICPIHGEFWQKPHIHLSGKGCKVCGLEDRRMSQNTYISKCNECHNSKYIYTKTQYKNARTDVIVTCPIHGDFTINASKHLQGGGCKKCARERNILARKWTTPKFINEATKVHGNKYDYSKVEYKGWYIPICITCKEHGEFWQTPEIHLHGCGCKKCSASKLENTISRCLFENNIKYEVGFNKFLWLGKMHLDFYLPEYNIAIECQGGQHFFAVDYFGGEEGFKKTQQRDVEKLRLCGEHNIKLLYYSDIKDFDTFLDEPLIKDTETLLDKINEIKNEQVNAKFGNLFSR